MALALDQRIRESSESINAAESVALLERIDRALQEQNSHEYITPSGATLTLLTELAVEGKLAAMSLAYITFKGKYEPNAKRVAERVPAKLTNGYFIKFLNLDALRVVRWEQKNPLWAQQSIDALQVPNVFAQEVSEMARRMAGDIPI